ncbi:MAG: iron-sulfur cluster assembly scaffold protein [Candidatus Omnitrophota bacterium]|nr:iron-sulfur cluster assembly scaffold protein [Candidatus Omnitrophota bacterium]
MGKDMIDMGGMSNFNISTPMSSIIKKDKFFGRMNDPTACAVFIGPCGDEMEFYLVIEEGRITEAKCYTKGCEETKMCGLMVAYLAHNKTINEALAISAGEVIKKLKNLSFEHLHCSILAVSTLYRAIADYLLKK